jgi:hypothetical protein
MCNGVRHTLRITHSLRFAPSGSGFRKTQSPASGLCGFSRTHIPARRKTFGFALLGGQERRQFFTLCDIRKNGFEDYFAQIGSKHRYIHVVGVLFFIYCNK